MRIDLAGWSSEGLRSPDVTVDLTNKEGTPAKVALVQMPNGTGKTTTLELLKAALNNSAVGWSPEYVRSFRRRADTRSEGRFTAKLLVDGRPLTFELTLDFENGATRYRTTKVGSGGIGPGWEPPPEVHKFLAPEFLRLFIFDGEFASDLLDSKKAEADRAIDALCQLYLLNEVAQFAEGEWDRQSRSGPKTNAGLARYQTEQAALLKRRDELRKMEAKAEKEVTSRAAEIAALEAKVNQHLATMKSTQVDHAQAAQQLNDAQQALFAAVGTAMGTMRMPVAIDASFASGLVALKTNLDKLRLPENTSAQFFEELVNESECICGREMTVGARAEISNRSKRYLDADESGIINALKSDIDTFTAADGGETLAQKLVEQLDELGTASHAERLAQQRVRTLKQRLIDEGDEQLKAWEQALAEHRQHYLEFEEILGRIQGDGVPEETPIFSLKLLDKQLREVSSKIAEITATVTLRQQTDAVKDVLARAAEIARHRIKDELVEQANQRLKDILINDPLEIARIDRSLRLAGQEGASVGQILSVGYTFLMSVLSRGKNDFPLVVDSPANPIDADVRENVGRLIPDLCTQFVGFTINTEREGFVPALERAAGEIRFLTMFRKTPGTERLMPGLPKTGVSKTETAVLVDDRDYFMRFGVKSEEEL